MDTFKFPDFYKLKTFVVDNFSVEDWREYLFDNEIERFLA